MELRVVMLDWSTFRRYEHMERETPQRKQEVGHGTVIPKREHLVAAILPQRQALPRVRKYE